MHNFFHFWQIRNFFFGKVFWRYFKHWETYDPETGTAKSFLVSLKEQEVAINELNLNINFKAWETIHTEISQKYDDEVVEWLADEAGLKVIEFFKLRLFFDLLILRRFYS